MGDSIEKGPSTGAIVPRIGGQQPVSQESLTKFLDALSRCGNISQACEHAGIARITAYRHKESDPTFAKHWDEALRIGLEALEDEAKRRGYSGWEEPVIYQGQPQHTLDKDSGELVPLTVRKYSDTLLIFLLNGAFPEKYKSRAQTELTGPNGGPIQTIGLQAVANLPTEDLKSLREILSRAGQAKA